MDFFGRQTLERNVPIEQCNSAILLYDTRCKRTTSVALQLAKEHGIIPDRDNKTELSPRGFLMNANLIDSDNLSKVSAVYLNFKPRYIPLLNNNQCDQRRTSYRTWLAVKMYHYSTYITKPVSANSFPQVYANSVRDSISSTVRKNFVELANTNLSTRIYNTFPLPLFLNKPKSERDIQVWLARMSRWRYATKDLHPVLCKFTGSNDFFEMRDNLPSTLEKCDVCKAIIGSEEPKAVELTDNREDVYEKRKTFGAVDKGFVELVMMITSILAHNIIAYLTSIKLGNKEADSFLELLESTRKALQDTEDRVGKLYKRKRKVKQMTEYSIVGTIIEVMNHVSKGYARRKFYICSENGDRKDLIYQTLHRVQNLICNYMDEFSYHCVTLFYSRFDIGTKKALLLEILKSFNLYVTWSSMNKLLEENYVNQVFHPKPVPKPTEIRCAFRLVHMEILHDVLSIVYETMRDCDIHLFGSRIGTSSVNLIELSTICDDFPMFIGQLPNFCRYSLQDLYGHTNGKLLTFMKETNACYETNRHLIDATIQDAKDHMTYRFGRMQEPKSE